MRSFLAGKQAHEAGLNRPAAEPACATVRGGPLHLPQFGKLAPATAGANVEVVKEGDKVVRLVVTCACGERVEVECLYSAGR
jgi:hypothetical protein